MTPIKDPAESIVIHFDFSSELTAIDTAAMSVAICGDGADPAIADIRDGPHQISGTSVLQRVGLGVAGVNYTMRCVATRGDDVIVRSDIMPVRNAPY